MKKKYNLNEPESENGLSQSSRVEEPMTPYYRGKKLSPPLTQEELKNALTTEEVQTRIFRHIDKLFGE